MTTDEPSDDLKRLAIERHERLLAALDSLIEYASGTGERYGRPHPDSQAAAETAAVPELEAPTTAQGQVGMALTIAADSMWAMRTALELPLHTFAPWVLARAVLENTSTAMWLLEPDGLVERLERSLTKRVHELRLQRTYAVNAADRAPDIGLDETLQQIEQRIQQCAATAKYVGLAPKLNDRDEVIGFGAGMVNLTGRVDRAFGAVSEYGLMSAVVHGDDWATMRLTMRPMSGGTESGRGTPFEQSMSPNTAAWLITSVLNWFAHAEWAHQSFMGWDLERLAATLEQIYDDAGLTQEVRFWRTYRETQEGPASEDSAPHTPSPSPHLLRKLHPMTTDTPSGLDQLAIVEQTARTGLAAADNDAALEQWRTSTLGRSGALTGILRSIGNLDPEERKAVGQAANVLKNQLEAALEERQLQLKRAALEGAQPIDVTLPGRPRRIGRLHPVTQTLRQMLDVLQRLGFAVVEGPEVELGEYNFDKLRIPEHHPARDMWDTFWIAEREAPGGAESGQNLSGARQTLLRTHTSPMQIRYMEDREPPIRVAVPGRCYRYEATDATHEWMLQQVELLAIDEGISLADLKGTLHEFARQIFGPETEVMLRNSYFPFVEPGVELAVKFRGKWLEILGAGMVHPEIIEAAGYDPERYTGFAAGMGVERIAMSVNDIDDIRNFYANDLRFLSQF